MAAEPLIIGQTSTGYWVVLSGTIELAGALTRAGAEAECERLRRLRERAHDGIAEVTTRSPPDAPAATPARLRQSPRTPA